MRRLDGKGDIKIGLLGRLAGFKLVEDSAHHVVIRLPWWSTEGAREKVEDNYRHEISMLDRARGTIVKREGRLLRIERPPVVVNLTDTPLVPDRRGIISGTRPRPSNPAPPSQPNLTRRHGPCCEAGMRAWPEPCPWHPTEGDT